MKKLVIVASLIVTGAANASVYTGTVQQVLAQASPTTPGNTRVSIYVGGFTTSCAGTGWFSFDLPNSSQAPFWQAMALTAVAQGISVKITGTGTCDAYSIEMVEGIYVLAP